MSFFPRRSRSKSTCSALQVNPSASLSCPNLLDLDEDISEADVGSECTSALTPGPEMLSLSLASSPKENKTKKLHKLLPSKFRRAKERKAQTEALKLSIYPLSNSFDSSSSRDQCSLEPPSNVRPKHTRPTGLGLGLGSGFLGGSLLSPRCKLRRGSDSLVPSPTSNRNRLEFTDGERLSGIREDSDTYCDVNVKPPTHRRFTIAPPSSAPPIFIVVSRSGEGKGSGNLLGTDGYKKFLGKSLEQVWCNDFNAWRTINLYAWHCIFHRMIVR